MTITHVCQFKLAHSNGIQAAVWELAKAQAAAGHAVEILSLGREPRETEVSECRIHGVGLHGHRGALPRFAALREEVRKICGNPDPVVHFHSVFIPWHTALAALLRRAGVAGFVSPHGNLAPSELRRKRWRKRLYLMALEAKNLGSAAGCLCASPQETSDVTALGCGARSFLLGNGTAAPPEIPDRSARSGQGTRGIALAKSDVVNKGFHRMFQISEAFPGGIDFFVVPHNQRKLHAEFEQLVSQRPPSARVHPPVHGEAKAAALAAADCLVHLSRWEVFGMSIVEGAMAGLPLILSEECDLAAEAEAAGAAHVMRSYDASALEELRERLCDHAWLDNAGRRAHEWAVGRYSSAAVAERAIELYRQCLKTS
jgi:glycosyltransferase involved in cell wall biosynthesis